MCVCLNQKWSKAQVSAFCKENTLGALGMMSSNKELLQEI